MTSAALIPGKDRRVAVWLDANAVNGWGYVTGISDNGTQITVRSDGRAPLSSYVLDMEPYTRFELSGGSATVIGVAHVNVSDHVRQGDLVNFSGTTDTPGSNQLWIYRLNLSR